MWCSSGGGVTTKMSGLARKTYGLWMGVLLVSFQVLGAEAKLCVYSQDRTDVFTYRVESVLNSEECQWGCCEDSGSPCCSAPMNMKVGVVLGALVIFVIMTTLICYYCVYRRNQPCINALRKLKRRWPATTTPETSNSPVFFSGSSVNAHVGVLQRYDDDPPSYEDVMKGHPNAAFKPDAAESDDQRRDSPVHIVI